MIGSHQTAAHDMESDTRVINRQSLLSLRAFYVVHELHLLWYRNIECSRMEVDLTKDVF